MNVIFKVKYISYCGEVKSKNTIIGVDDDFDLTSHINFLDHIESANIIIDWIFVKKAVFVEKIKKHKIIKKKNEDKQLFNAWLTNNGKIIAVNYMGHNDYAIKWFRDKFKKDYHEKLEEYEDKYGFHYPYEFLHLKGWVRIETFTAGKTRVLGNCSSDRYDTCMPSLNQIQKDFLINWCIENKIKYEKLFIN